MQKECPLSELGRGERALVCSLSAGGAIRRRLIDIGIAPGASIRHLFKSCSGEPTAYLIQDSVIALRSEDAATIQVLPL